MATGSLNLYKSFTYAQPETYHFSHDSVFLARKVFEIIRDENLHSDRVLDLCAGCGIVGLDYAFHVANELGRASKVDFVEVQKIYEPFLNKNIQTLNSLFSEIVTSECIFENYANLHLNHQMHEKYDLLLCNPPYFRLGQGKLSPSEFKNRCRFFIDSGFKELMQAISFLLKPRGSAFILLQSLTDHNINIISEVEGFQLFTVKNRGLIRATGFFQLTKI